MSVAAALSPYLLVEAEPGMGKWWNDMWGGGKGKGGKGKGGDDIIRPILINAPPLYAPNSYIPHHRPKPHFHGHHGFKHGGFGHGGGHGFGGGFGHGGHGFGGGFGNNHIGHVGHGPLIKHAPIIKHTPSLYQGPKVYKSIPIKTTVHHGPAVVKESKTITHHGGVHHDAKHASGGHSHGIKKFRSNDIGSSYASTGYNSPTGYVKSHGFGPVKDDDLILEINEETNFIHSIPNDIGAESYSAPIPVVEEHVVPDTVSHDAGGHDTDDSSEEVHEVPAPTIAESVDLRAIHDAVPPLPLSDTDTIAHSFDLSPPPVYVSGSNAVSDSYAGHSIDGATASLVQADSYTGHSTAITTTSEVHAAPVVPSLPVVPVVPAAPVVPVVPAAPLVQATATSFTSSSDEISAPLPMAPHGTSSESYFAEGPVGRSFAPSEQIPFPGNQIVPVPSIVTSSDTVTSYSAPQASITSRKDSGFLEEAVVSYDRPLGYSDPVIEIVFQEAKPTSQQPTIDPSIYQQAPASDDVEVYFIEVSDDGSYDSVDDLDLDKALAGVKEEFPNGLPSELSRTLVNSGYLDNAQIEVLDLDEALKDSNVRSALEGQYGSGSQNSVTVVKVEKPVSESVEKPVSNTERRKRLAPSYFRRARSMAKPRFESWGQNHWMPIQL